MYIIMKSDELVHHGVKGMKWGVRNDKKGSGKSNRQAKKEANIERKRQKAMSVHSSARYTYKQRKHLSDAELRARINRLNMEKQLKDLSKGNGGALISSGSQATTNALGKYGAKMLLGATVGPDAAAFIKPKK